MNTALQANGLNTLALHGDKEQYERESTIRQFKGDMNTLIATDVASRGLHIENVKIIINYDFPNQIETYVHRIGRSGRAGAKGTAYTFFNKKHFMLAPPLIDLLKRAEQEVPEGLIKYANLANSTKSHNALNKWNTRNSSIAFNSNEENKSENVDLKHRVGSGALAEQVEVAASTKSLNELSMSLANVSTMNLIKEKPPTEFSYQTTHKAPAKPISMPTIGTATEVNPSKKKKWGKK